jgi:hypothetical protein
MHLGGKKKEGFLQKYSIHYLKQNMCLWRGFLVKAHIQSPGKSSDLLLSSPGVNAETPLTWHLLRFSFPPSKNYCQIVVSHLHFLLFLAPNKIICNKWAKHQGWGVLFICLFLLSLFVIFGKCSDKRKFSCLSFQCGWGI